MDSHSAAAATTRWLERLEVADRATSKVETLSHGNQQRVQLAAALVHDPEVLVLDEPLAGLDPTGIDAIGEVLVEQARSGRCVLFSSHQLDLVEDLCESVAIIDHGRLVAKGTVDELADERRRAASASGWKETVRGHGRRTSRASPCRRWTAARCVSSSTTPPTATSVLEAARAAGRVTEFVFERRRLSEVFREAVGQ